MDIEYIFSKLKTLDDFNKAKNEFPNLKLSNKTIQLTKIVIENLKNLLLFDLKDALLKKVRPQLSLYVLCHVLFNADTRKWLEFSNDILELLNITFRLSNEYLPKHRNLWWGVVEAIAPLILECNYKSSALGQVVVKELRHEFLSLVLSPDLSVPEMDFLVNKIIHSLVILPRLCHEVDFERDRLGALLCSCADVSLQLDLLEMHVLLNLTPALPPDRPYSHLAITITRDRFDENARRFLNQVNLAEGGVVSLQCELLILGDENPVRIQAQDEPLWADWNWGSKTLTVLCRLPGVEPACPENLTVRLEEVRELRHYLSGGRPHLCLDGAAVTAQSPRAVELLEAHGAPERITLDMASYRPGILQHVLPQHLLQDELAEPSRADGPREHPASVRAGDDAASPVASDATASSITQLPFKLRNFQSIPYPERCTSKYTSEYPSIPERSECEDSLDFWSSGTIPGTPPVLPLRHSRKASATVTMCRKMHPSHETSKVSTVACIINSEVLRAATIACQPPKTSEVIFRVDTSKCAAHRATGEVTGDKRSATSLDGGALELGAEGRNSVESSDIGRPFVIVTQNFDDFLKENCNFNETPYLDPETIVQMNLSSSDSCLTRAGSPGPAEAQPSASKNVARATRKKIIRKKKAPKTAKPRAAPEGRRTSGDGVINKVKTFTREENIGELENMTTGELPAEQPHCSVSTPLVMRAPPKKSAIRSKLKLNIKVYENVTKNSPADKNTSKESIKINCNKESQILKNKNIAASPEATAGARKRPNSSEESLPNSTLNLSRRRKLYSDKTDRVNFDSVDEEPPSKSKVSQMYLSTRQEQSSRGKRGSQLDPDYRPKSKKVVKRKKPNKRPAVGKKSYLLDEAVRSKAIITSSAERCTDYIFLEKEEDAPLIPATTAEMMVPASRQKGPDEPKQPAKNKNKVYCKRKDSKRDNILDKILAVVPETQSEHDTSLPALVVEKSATGTKPRDFFGNYVFDRIKEDYLFMDTPNISINSVGYPKVHRVSTAPQIPDLPSPIVSSQIPDLPCPIISSQIPDLPCPIASSHVPGSIISSQTRSISWSEAASEPLLRDGLTSVEQREMLRKQASDVGVEKPHLTFITRENCSVSAASYREDSIHIIDLNQEESEEELMEPILRDCSVRLVDCVRVPLTTSSFGLEYRIKTKENCSDECRRSEGAESYREDSVHTIDLTPEESEEDLMEPILRDCSVRLVDFMRVPLTTSSFELEYRIKTKKNCSDECRRSEGAVSYREDSVHTVELTQEEGEEDLMRIPSTTSSFGLEYRIKTKEKCSDECGRSEGAVSYREESVHTVDMTQEESEEELMRIPSTTSSFELKYRKYLTDLCTVDFDALAQRLRVAGAGCAAAGELSSQETVERWLECTSAVGESVNRNRSASETPASCGTDPDAATTILAQLRSEVAAAKQNIERAERSICSLERTLRGPRVAHPTRRGRGVWR